MATESDGFATSSAQDIAIAALMRGASVTDAAKEANVSRQTVSSWKNQDPAFIATLNQARKDVWDQGMDRLRKIWDMALERINQGLEETADLETALVILKVLTKVNITPTGSTDAQYIADIHELCRALRILARRG